MTDSVYQARTPLSVSFSSYSASAMKFQVVKDGKWFWGKDGRTGWGTASFVVY